MRASARAFRDDEDGPVDDSLLTSWQNIVLFKKQNHKTIIRERSHDQLLALALSTNNQFLNVQVLRTLILLFQFRASLV